MIVYLPVSLPVIGLINACALNMSIYWYFCRCVCVHVNMSVCMFVSYFVRLSVFLCLFISLYVCLSVYLSVCIINYCIHFSCKQDIVSNNVYLNDLHMLSFSVKHGVTLRIARFHNCRAGRNGYKW